MSPRLPVVSGADVIRALGKVGYGRQGQRGSHVKLANDAGRTAIVPMHRELAPGTLRSVLRQAGLTAGSSSRSCDLLAQTAAQMSALGTPVEAPARAEGTDARFY
jgi:predicted RNA binding protein YcfA (HicA-like mRNA interferase family)